MQDVSRSEGRTVLFVSHNMVSIQQLCHTGLLLKNGMIETSGPISDVVNIYLSNIKTVNDYNRHGNGAVKTTDFKTTSQTPMPAPSSNPWKRARNATSTA